MIRTEVKFSGSPPYLYETLPSESEGFETRMMRRGTRSTVDRRIGIQQHAQILSSYCMQTQHIQVKQGNQEQRLNPNKQTLCERFVEQEIIMHNQTGSEAPQGEIIRTLLCRFADRQLPFADLTRFQIRLMYDEIYAVTRNVLFQPQLDGSLATGAARAINTGNISNQGTVHN